MRSILAIAVLTALFPGTALSESPEVGDTPPSDILLNILYDPAGSLVTIDGQPVGETPILSLRLAPGRHAVQIRLADDEDIEITLDQDFQESQTLNGSLACNRPPGSGRYSCRPRPKSIQVSLDFGPAIFAYMATDIGIDSGCWGLLTQGVFEPAVSVFVRRRLGPFFSVGGGLMMADPGWTLVLAAFRGYMIPDWLSLDLYVGTHLPFAFVWAPSLEITVPVHRTVRLVFANRFLMAYFEQAVYGRYLPMLGFEVVF